VQPEQIIIKPVVTEKSMLARVKPCYVFRIHAKATKVDVAQAVERLFKVKVKSVNTSAVKAKRRVRGRSIGRTPGWKKAYVCLETGQKIEELEV